MKRFTLYFSAALLLVLSACKKDDKKKDDGTDTETNSLATAGPGVYDIDSNFYTTAYIWGCGEWMTANLKTSHYANGDTIFSGRNLDDISAMSQPSYFFYSNGDSSTSMTRYGRLYTWYVVEDPRGLCPTGWHVASRNDWDTLKKYLGGQEVAGGKLKGSSYWASPNAGADNSSLFNALPAGYRTPEEVYAEISKTAIFWTLSPDTAGRSWSYYVKSNYPTLFQAPNERNNAYSVRCKRD